MARTILDDELRRWEVFASTGPNGFPRPGRLVFRCISDRTEPSRAALFEEGKAGAEEAVVALPLAELRSWLERSVPLR
jgi:hypothetical protein